MYNLEEYMELKSRYEELFNSDEQKAKAFDKIAECYYLKNFGSVSKADIDLLMFSIYIEEILCKTEDDINTYSDYTLSKDLGIPQSRIRNLKERKELKYPYPEFDWRRSFERFSRNAIYEDGKIKLELRDKNLYNELKNCIENVGGFVDIQLNSTLLQVPLKCYVDFLCELEEEKNRKEIQNELKQILEKNKIEYHNDKTIKEQLIESGINITENLICDIIEEIPFGNTVRSIVENTSKLIKRKVM